MVEVEIMVLEIELMVVGTARAQEDGGGWRRGRRGLKRPRLKCFRKSASLENIILHSECKESIAWVWLRSVQKYSIK